MTTFDTIADAMTAGTTLSTGLPQLDRLAPLGPGHLAVMIGASGTGKSRVADHVAATLTCTHERGVLTVSHPTTLDAIDSTLAFATPALVIIDPLSALATPLGAVPADLMPTPRNSPVPPPDPELDDLPEQFPVHPAELGRLAGQLRDLAQQHQVPILACHRYTPIRDSVTGQIVSTESVNPMLNIADVVFVARVQADPRMIGLEIMRNKLGPRTTLRLPLSVPAGYNDAEVPADRKD